MFWLAAALRMSLLQSWTAARRPQPPAQWKSKLA
jgi:hypothetical protein